MSVMAESSGSGKTKLEKATVGDIVLSLILPGWGILVGLIALAKSEFRRSTTMIGLSVAVIVVLVIWRSVSSSYSAASQTTVVSHDPSIEEQLQSVANEVQQKAPVMVDADTRLDGARAGPGLLFTYLYTFPQMEAKRSVSKAQFEEQATPTLKTNACGNNALKPFFDHGVVVRYVYRDHNGVDLGTVTLTRDSCNTP